MKITKWTKKLSAALVAGGLLVPAAVHAAPLDTNLLVDPGFEDVDSGSPGAYGALPLNSWSDGTSTGFTYATGQYDNGGPLAGGQQRYFTSNQSTGGNTDAAATGDVAQMIDVSSGDSATLIASGEARYIASGFFTTYDTDEDFGKLHLDFLDGGAGSLGTGEIGPDVNEGGWTQHSGSGSIPIGTASILVSVYGGGINGGPDGYIDNTSLVISRVPEPTSLGLAGLGLAGAGLVRRRRMEQ